MWVGLSAGRPAAPFGAPRDAPPVSRRGKVFIAASPAAEAALAIIRGGAARLRELFYPWWLQPVHGLWVLLPNPRVLQSFYNYSGPCRSASR